MESLASLQSFIGWLGLTLSRGCATNNSAMVSKAAAQVDAFVQASQRCHCHCHQRGWLFVPRPHLFVMPSTGGCKVHGFILGAPHGGRIGRRGGYHVGHRHGVSNCARNSSALGLLSNSHPGWLQLSLRTHTNCNAHLAQLTGWHTRRSLCLPRSPCHCQCRPTLLAPLHKPC